MLDILVISCSTLKKEKIKCHHQKFTLFYLFFKYAHLMVDIQCLG